jgi:hypothetical protein
MRVDKPQFLRQRRRRNGERGQMAVLMAIFATLLLSAVAIATDLSITTHYKRYLQNVTDSAAMAGAKLLPPNPSSSDQQNATAAALLLLHNSYPFSSPGPNWASNWANQNCGASSCSITVCAGLIPAGGSPPCDKTVSPGSATPSWFTVNTPPKTAKVTQYNGNSHFVEVYGSQQAAAFFAGVFGLSANRDAAESVAHHFAPGQPFPFALYSHTWVLSGNQNETIQGNIYSDRLISPQSSGQAGVCAAPDVNGNPGYIVLGYPQSGDGSPPYQNDGQSTTGPKAHPLVVNDTCPESGGSVGMSANPPVSGCAGAYPGNTSGSALTYDSVDRTCEANPPITPPSLAPLPNLPVYGGTVCGGGGIVSGKYTPNEYKCSSGPALTVSLALLPGIYEIDPGASTGGCDVVINDPAIALTGVTFYLKGNAGICITINSGQTISQTAFNAGTGDAGDGRYAILSDNAGAPSVSLSSGGGGSTSGVYSVTGVIWLPTGSVKAGNKVALEDTGQVICNSWDVQSGNHQNPGVSYDSSLAPSQIETLTLTE